MNQLSTSHKIVAAVVAVYGLLSVGSLVAADARGGGAKGKKPNVIVILTDDNDQLSWAISGDCCEFL
jgi:hypothetical protein